MLSEFSSVAALSVSAHSPSDEIVDSLGMRKGAVEIALAHLEGTGNILRGRFTPARTDEEFCDRRILARIHRETIGRLRREIEPVPPATFMRFLIAWQRAAPPWNVRDEGGLLDVIEQLQGFEAAAGAWESVDSARLASWTTCPVCSMSCASPVM